MRWVKDTFPPRFRRRKLLMTMRLSPMSLAGTARTEVAVGTSSEAVMFRTTAADAPRSGADTSSAPPVFSAIRAALAALLATRSSGVAVVELRRAGAGSAAGLAAGFGAVGAVGATAAAGFSGVGGGPALPR